MNSPKDAGEEAQPIRVASSTARLSSTYNATLDLGTLVHNDASLVDFSTSGVGAGAANITYDDFFTVPGLVGGYATFGPSDWAVHSNRQITRAAGYDNDQFYFYYNVNVTQDQSTYPGFNINSLRFATSATVSARSKYANASNNPSSRMRCTASGGSTRK